MPEIPPDAVRAGAEVRMRQYESEYSLGNLTVEDFEPEVRAILDAAAPVLAEHVAQKITEHAERQRPRLPDRVPDAWHRHFSIAARIAAGAFDTAGDRHRMAAEAIETAYRGVVREDDGHGK